MADPKTNPYEPDRVSPPGDTLLETIQALGMSQAQLAERLGRPKKTVNEIIRAKAAITPETALQLESVLGVTADFWMNREARYRESLARQREERLLAHSVDWARKFPFRAMVRCGWVADRPTGPARARELLRFFGVATPESWEQTWSQLEVAFRRSTNVEGKRHAIAAWLRQGEIAAQALECAPFDAGRFRNALDDARALTCTEPEVFEPGLTQMFARVGVAVAWVREIPGAPVSGATRWLGPDKALIQVSLRYKTDDQLWFSIFHEAIHVLKHPRRAVFIEDGGRDSDEEREANRQAAAMLIPPVSLGAFVAQGVFTVQAIQAFASRLGIAPGIVVGRLQHERRVPFSHGNALKRRLGWVDGGA